MCGAKAASRSHDDPRPANLAAGQGSATWPQILKRGARPSGPGHTFAPLRSRRPYKPPALARLFPQADSSATLGSTVVMTTSGAQRIGVLTLRAMRKDREDGAEEASP